MKGGVASEALAGIFPLANLRRRVNELLIYKKRGQRPRVSQELGGFSPSRTEVRGF